MPTSKSRSTVRRAPKGGARRTSKRPHVKKHMILDSEFVLRSDKHDCIWLPLSFCRGLVLHREGRPGIVVAHRITISKNAPRETPNAQQQKMLIKGLPVSLGGAVYHPQDLLAFMRKGLPAGGNFKLTVFKLPKRCNDKIRSHISPAIAEAKEAGWLKDVEFVEFDPAERDLPYIDATTGQIGVGRVRGNLRDKLFNSKEHNVEWTE